MGHSSPPIGVPKVFELIHNSSFDTEPYADLSVKWKIIGTILGLSGGIGNYFAIDGMQRAIRERRSKKQERNKEGSP